MTKPDVSIYLVSVQFNSITFNNTNGGPQGINLEYNGNNIPFYSGNDQWPVFNPVVDKSLSVTIELSEYAEEIESGTKSALVITIEKPGGTTSQITYNDMVFVGSSASQPRGAFASRSLRFVYEADTGATDPIFGS